MQKEAKEIGYIADYRRENAESLSFSDEEFDFVLRKESYHRFPRPIVALYEMLRVCKKAVVLIESNDPFIFSKFAHFLFINLKDFVKFLMGKEIIRHPFEELGNYIYAISKREIEKVASGLHLNMAAFRELNDYYIEGVGYEKAAKNSRLFRKIKEKINLLDFLSKIGLRPYSFLAAVIFKKNQPKNVRRSFLKINMKYYA